MRTVPRDDGLVGELIVRVVRTPVPADLPPDDQPT
jgi:hypothetical protein